MHWHVHFWTMQVALGKYVGESNISVASSRTGRNLPFFLLATPQMFFDLHNIGIHVLASTCHFHIQQQSKRELGKVVNLYLDAWSYCPSLCIRIVSEWSLWRELMCCSWISYLWLSAFALHMPPHNPGIMQRAINHFPHVKNSCLPNCPVQLTMQGVRHRSLWTCSLKLCFLIFSEKKSQFR